MRQTIIEDHTNMQGSYQLFRHYKGGEYKLICEAALESDRQSTMIVYSSSDGKIWIRPKEDFFGIVKDDKGVLRQRFESI